MKGTNPRLGLLVLINLLYVLDDRKLLTILSQTRKLNAKRQKGIYKVMTIISSS